MELADPYQVLLILPLLKQGKSFPFAETRAHIKEAVKKLVKKEKTFHEYQLSIEDNSNFSIPEYSFAELDSLEKEWIPYMRAIGRIVASMLIPYPPGIPLFIPGEKITVTKLSQLEELLAVGASFQGEHQLEEKMICVIKNQQ